MGLGDSSIRAELEPLATAIEVSVLPHLEVSQVPAPSVVTPAGACLEWDPLGVVAAWCSWSPGSAATIAGRLGDSTCGF